MKHKFRTANTNNENPITFINNNRNRLNTILYEASEFDSADANRNCKPIKLLDKKHLDGLSHIYTKYAHDCFYYYLIASANLLIKNPIKPMDNYILEDLNLDEILFIENQAPHQSDDISADFELSTFLLLKQTQFQNFIQFFNAAKNMFLNALRTFPVEDYNTSIIIFKLKYTDSRIRHYQTELKISDDQLSSYTIATEDIFVNIVKILEEIASYKMQWFERIGKPIPEYKLKHIYSNYIRASDYKCSPNVLYDYYEFLKNFIEPEK